MKPCFVILAVAIVACHTNDPAKFDPVDPIADCNLPGPTVTPPAATVHRGDSLQIAAQEFSCDVPLQRHRVRWTTSDTTVAVVDSLGMARSRAVGRVTIIAQWIDDPNVAGAMALTVVP